MADAKNVKEMLGVTFQGSVTFNGPMFDIHDNQHVHIDRAMPETDSTDRDRSMCETDSIDRDKSMCETDPTDMTVASRSAASATPPTGRTDESAEELFHFVHPAVDGDDEWQVHREVRRLVMRQGLQEICRHLLQMKKERRVLLPQSPSSAYAELVRMGMPSGEGFAEKTFRKYYRCQ
jgi:hypothetical protein